MLELAQNLLALAQTLVALAHTLLALPYSTFIDTMHRLHLPIFICMTCQGGQLHLQPHPLVEALLAVEVNKP